MRENAFVTSVFDKKKLVSLSLVRAINFNSSPNIIILFIYYFLVNYYPNSIVYFDEVYVFLTWKFLTILVKTQSTESLQWSK